VSLERHISGMRPLLAVVLLAFTAAGRPAGTSPSAWSGPPGSSKPFLTRTPRGELLLSWFERRPDHRFALRVAATDNGRWSEPVTAVESDRLFVNWADFPSVVETTRGTWVVHWLEKSAVKSFAYDIRLATTKDRGRTWTTPYHRQSRRNPDRTWVRLDGPGAIGTTERVQVTRVALDP
jgi:hypothetical protein